MNILIITAVGGFLPKFIMQDVRLLMSRGHSVYYATNFENPVYECNREELEAMGIKCFQIPIEKSPAALFKNCRAFNMLKKIVNNEKIDAVYLHNPMGGVLGRLLTFVKKELKVIYVAHGFHFYKGAPIKNWLLFYPVERWLAKRTDVIVTINTEDRIQAERFKLRKDGTVVQIPGVGVDTERFRPDAEKRKKLREELGLRDNDFVLLSVGELNKNKNHATTIIAFSELDLPDAKMVICGDGPMRNQLEELIEMYGLEDRVYCCGYKTNVEDFCVLADAFVFPSVREGLGMAAVEAMACGLPLIVADNRGSREYSGKNAIICEATDTDAFARAMRELASDRDKCNEMAAISLKTAEKFSKAKTLTVMKEVFQRLEDC